MGGFTERSEEGVKVSTEWRASQLSVGGAQWATHSWHFWSVARLISTHEEEGVRLTGVAA
jgi:hypothetical protein